MKRPMSAPMRDGLASAGCVTLDIHGKNAYQARVAIDAALRDMIYDEYSSRANVLRVVRVGDGVTELILREL